MWDELYSAQVVSWTGTICLDSRCLDVATVEGVTTKTIRMPQFTGHLVEGGARTVIATFLVFHLSSSYSSMLRNSTDWYSISVIFGPQGEMLNYLRDVTVIRFPVVTYIEIEGAYIHDLAIDSLGH